MKSPSTWPTACAAPHSISAHTATSGVYPSSATTVTADALTNIDYGCWIPYGAPNVVKSLRAALGRMTGYARWSVYRTATGHQIAVANIGQLRVSAEAADSETAIHRLRDLVVSLEKGRKALKP